MEEYNGTEIDGMASTLSASEVLEIIDSQSPPLEDPTDDETYGEIDEEIGIDLDDVTVELDIHDAAERGDLAEVELFLRLSPDEADVGNEHGTTPLMKACIGGSQAIAECLVRAGANLDASNEWGNTALHYACVNSHMHLIRFLLDRGADPDVENAYGSRPWDELIELNKWQKKDAEEMLTRASLLKRSEFRAQAEVVERVEPAATFRTPLKSLGSAHSSSPLLSNFTRKRCPTPVLGQRQPLPEVNPPRASSVDRLPPSAQQDTMSIEFERRRLSEPESMNKSQKKSLKVIKWVKEKLQRGAPPSGLLNELQLPPHSSSPPSQAAAHNVFGNVRSDLIAPNSRSHSKEEEKAFKGDYLHHHHLKPIGTPPATRIPFESFEMRKTPENLESPKKGKASGKEHVSVQQRHQIPATNSSSLKPVDSTPTGKEVHGTKFSRPSAHPLPEIGLDNSNTV